MKTLAITVAALLMAIKAVLPDGEFTSIDLSAIAN
jgi:hypothetical protein